MFEEYNRKVLIIIKFRVRSDDCLESKDYAHYISSLAQRAVLYEVSTTPKPGLVDRNNSGAHRDMDFFTFMASSSVLYRGFYECALKGILSGGMNSGELLKEIRPIGIKCENSMFQATGGVNTHKGIIFSMGLICSAAGRLYSEKGELGISTEGVCIEAAKIAEGISSRDFEGIENKEKHTNGEILYKALGLRGIRGEAEGGFKTVRDVAVPFLRSCGKLKDSTLNDTFLEILLRLMAVCADTNVIIRGGLHSLEFVKASAREFILAGGMNQASALEKLEEMNKVFIERNISPGGSADLLAVSIFLGLLEGIVL